jgi:hypothetical protein
MTDAQYVTPGKLGRVLLRFMVTFSITIAPNLGSIAVPHYVPLVNAIPEDQRSLYIVLSSFVLSIFAMIAQFFLNSRFKKNVLRGMFGVIAIGFVISFFLLTRELILGVARVSYNGGRDVSSFIVGIGDRPSRCDKLCDPTDSDGLCITNLTMNPAKIESCWGDSRMREARLNIMKSYLLVMVCAELLAALILARAKE